jgi:hypothetical protein
MLIKSRNFSPTKCENTWEKDGFGWAPGQEKRFEGTVINKIRYGKNYEHMMGTCKKCDKYTGKTGTNGEHCALPANEHCQK